MRALSFVLLPAAMLSAALLSACATLKPTPEHLREALRQTPGAWLSGAPRGLAYEPLVLNNEDFVWTIAPTPGGEGAAFSRMATRDVYASLWRLEEAEGVARGELACELALNETAFDIEGMAYMPSGEVLLAASRNGKLYALEAASCRLLGEQAFGKPLAAVAVDARGERIAVGTADGWVGLVSWPFAEEKLFFEALHTDEVRALAFSPAGHVFSGGFDKRVVQWQVKAGAEGAVKLEKQKEFVFESHVNDFSLDALGETLGIALSEEKAERTLEVHKRERRGEKEPVRAGDGGALVNVETGERKAFFPHRGTVTTAGISPDGQMLATGGFDKRVLFHRLGEAKPWERALGWSIRRVRFSPSGRYVWIAAWTPQTGQNKGSTPSALAYEVIYGEEAFVREPPPAPEAPTPPPEAPEGAAEEATCAGTTCAGTTCAGTACAGTTCAGTACAGTTCAGTACAGTTCAGTACAEATCAEAATAGTATAADSTAEGSAGGL